MKESHSETIDPPALSVLWFKSYRDEERVITKSSVQLSAIQTNKWNLTHEFYMDASRAIKGNQLMIPITKTHQYKFDPLKPHFYIVKLGFTGVNIIFLISAIKHRLWVQYLQSMFWAEIWKNIRIFIWKLSVFGGEIFNHHENMLI